MQKYLIGIDQGGTKTDYLLTSIDGVFVDFQHHLTHAKSETPDYNKIINEMKSQLDALLKRNNIKINDVEAAGVGFALMPQESKREALENTVAKILGLKKLKFSADTTSSALLGRIDGTGVSAFASTGSVVIGQANTGSGWETVSIGGAGYLTADKASGSYIREKALSLLYSYHYRCGNDSIMFPELLELLKVRSEELYETYLYDKQRIDRHSSEIICIIDNAALAGDEIAMLLLNEAGENMAQAVAGCIRRLSLVEHGTAEKPLDISLLGSIWHKLAYDGMRASFASSLQQLTDKVFKLIMVTEPPAVAGVFVAKKLTGAPFDILFRHQVSITCSIKATEAEINHMRKSASDADLLRFLLVTKLNKADIASVTNVNNYIYEILSKYPLLQNVSAKLALSFLPSVCAIIKGDYPKALERFITGSQYARIAEEEIESYFLFGINCAAAAEDENRYIHLNKARISNLIENNRIAEAKKELEEFLQLLPDDEELKILEERLLSSV